jgi:adenylyltransferase/sulfurtransferase
VIRYEGQTFALAARPIRAACYRCFFPHSPAPGALPTCSSAGVLGPVAGAVALRQVQLGLALLRGEDRAGSLGLYDGKAGIWTSLTGRTDPDCIACGPEADDPALRGAAEGSGRTGCAG